MHTYIFLFRFFSHKCYYKIPSIIPCAAQSVLHRYTHTHTQSVYLLCKRYCVYVTPEFLIYPSPYPPSFPFDKHKFVFYDLILH